MADQAGIRYEPTDKLETEAAIQRSAMVVDDAEGNGSSYNLRRDRLREIERELRRRYYEELYRT